MNAVNYKVSRISGAPNFDSLPVASISLYPLEKRDYKPYAQCILCVSEQKLVLRMWAFEVSPPEQSSLRCVLYPLGDRPELALTVELTASGEAKAWWAEEGNREGVPLNVRLFSGEDLQGVYWGGTVELALPDLAQAGQLRFTPGDAFPGNFYKLCPQEPFVHQGSCFPADFTGRNPWGRESMGELQVVGW